MNFGVTETRIMGNFQGSGANESERWWYHWVILGGLGGVEAYLVGKHQVFRPGHVKFDLSVRCRGHNLHHH